MADGTTKRVLMRCTKCGATMARYYSAKLCLRRTCRGKLEWVEHVDKQGRQA